VTMLMAILARLRRSANEPEPQPAMSTHVPRHMGPP